MSSLERYLYATWFAALLLVAVMFGLIGYTPKTIPTGFAQPNLELEIDRLLDDGYYQSIDTYIANRLPLLGLGLWARGQVEYNLMGDSPVADVTTGIDGWLFYTDYVHVDCAGFDIPSPFAEFNLTRDQLVYFVSEAKSSFYSDQLAEFQQPEPCEVEGRRARREATRNDPLGMALDEQLERISADNPIFIPTDTHWSPFARTKVAQRLVNRFSPDLWVQSELESVETSYIADLTQLMGLDDHTVVADFVPDLDDVEILSETRVEYRDLVVNATSHSDRADAIPGVTLIVGDSQMAYTLPYLLPYFEDLIFVNWLVVDIGKTQFPEIGSVDRIVVQSVEAAWPGRSASPAIANLVGKLTP